MLMVIASLTLGAVWWLQAVEEPPVRIVTERPGRIPESVDRPLGP
ncbi:MAG: hypothetical protein QGG90_09990 [Nitrospinota bacterium]|jgi:hypothetical protein|nr:hypothetical protein [Nitrospinota bacterium]MDP6619745.1 hypothetical protein [Nitrospinota bacterium]MDP7384980.1 hypothetical protein [Nitrospinota bacterium]